jgi:hypothetical protein
MNGGDAGIDSMGILILVAIVKDVAHVAIEVSAILRHVVGHLIVSRLLSRLLFVGLIAVSVGVIVAFATSSD